MRSTPHCWKKRESLMHFSMLCRRKKKIHYTEEGTPKAGKERNLSMVMNQLGIWFQQSIIWWSAFPPPFHTQFRFVLRFLYFPRFSLNERKAETQTFFKFEAEQKQKFKKGHVGIELPRLGLTWSIKFRLSIFAFWRRACKVRARRQVIYVLGWRDATLSQRIVHP